jgi:hypothetical protein
MYLVYFISLISLVYKVEIVDMYVCVFICMFAYSSRRDKPIWTKFDMIIPWDYEENTEGSKLRKSVLSSIPGEGGPCSSETKHDRRTAPRPKLFVSKKRLQKWR